MQNTLGCKNILGLGERHPSYSGNILGGTELVQD
jgi:hypothetical protein